MRRSLGGGSWFWVASDACGTNAREESHSDHSMVLRAGPAPLAPLPHLDQGEAAHPQGSAGLERKILRVHVAHGRWMAASRITVVVSD